MDTDKEDMEFEKKILQMEIPLKSFISEEEKETSWKAILLTIERDDNKRRFIQHFHWMAAASVLITVGVVVWLNLNTGFKTNEGEKLNVNLSDGSLVTLNNKSRLTLNDEFGNSNRNVSLEGEAFFNIKKDESQPFTISIGLNEVIVVGTSFNISYKNKLAEITVRSGRVQLHMGNELLNLEGGEKGMISPAGELSKVPWDSNDFAWYSKTLILKERSLKEVAQIISELFNKNVEVAPSISSCTLSAKIEYETIDDILIIIKETLGVEWKYNSNQIHIYGKGC